MIHLRIAAGKILGRSFLRLYLKSHNLSLSLSPTLSSSPKHRKKGVARESENGHTLEEGLLSARRLAYDE